MQRRSHRGRFGYVVLPRVQMPVCVSPVDERSSRLSVTPAWISKCFMPAYRRAFLIWGPNSRAITAEILGQLVPSMRIFPTTGAERELERRVELAVAALLNMSGYPTPYPKASTLPRPLMLPAGTPWDRALLTGWAR